MPAKLEAITIPAEVTLEKVPGVIVDYSKREQSEQDLDKEIEKASVICLVYSLSDEVSKSMLAAYWLPKINEIEESLYLNSLKSDSILTASLPPRIIDANKNVPKRPIIIVANKLDENNDPNRVLTSDSSISSLILSNPQIETCIQCSAKTLKNVPEVFYYAQKSVLYPTAPVYDVDKKKLTSQAVKCFTRIYTTFKDRTAKFCEF